MGKTERLSAAELKRFYDSVEFGEQFNYFGDDLGVCYKKEASVFKVWAPTADRITLNLYKDGLVGEPYERIQMTRSFTEKGVWEIRKAGDLNGIYYTYSVDVNGMVCETQDVYSVACGVNGQRSMVVDLKATNPDGWDKDMFWYENTKQPVIYEVHVKDFSSNVHSGIPEEFRGKYKAFTVTDSTLDEKGEVKTCVSYLKELGVTHVHLLPCFDFGSVDESRSSKDQFNWGYDPVNYNVPEGSYSTDAFHGEVRIREFKEMVQALHKEGIGVIMDVVYNHTYSTDSCFQKTVPYYYYRVEEDGTLANGSICGNDTASERMMYRNYMIQSVCYWAEQYHIDGFRFDLMGLHDVDTMNAIRKALNQLPNGKHILMYGEPWFGKPSPMSHGAIPAVKANLSLLDEGIAIFCDDTRDAIKGSVFFEKEAGFVNGKKGLEEKIAASVKAWCIPDGTYQPKNPGQIISYVSAHDNFTLWDKLLYTQKEVLKFHKRDERIEKMNRLAAGIYMTCLGSVFFQAGEEFLRTKQGIGDSYKTDSSINELNWMSAKEQKEMVSYYKGLIQLRKEFMPLLSKNADPEECIKIHEKENGIVAFEITSDNTDDRYQRLFIVYNANEFPVTLDVPSGNWKVISDGTNFYKKLANRIENTQETIDSISCKIMGEERI